MGKQAMGIYATNFQVPKLLPLHTPVHTLAHAHAHAHTHVCTLGLPCVVIPLPVLPRAYCDIRTPVLTRGMALRVGPHRHAGARALLPPEAPGQNALHGQTPAYLPMRVLREARY
eukprot:3248909-Rhodomonas_salina.2